MCEIGEAEKKPSTSINIVPRSSEHRLKAARDALNKNPIWTRDTRADGRQLAGSALLRGVRNQEMQQQHFLSASCIFNFAHLHSLIFSFFLSKCCLCDHITTINSCLGKLEKGLPTEPGARAGGAACVQSRRRGSSSPCSACSESWWQKGVPLPVPLSGTFYV